MKHTLLIIAVVAVAFVGCTHSTNSGAVKPYTLKKCLVTDQEFDHDTYTFVHNGQEVKLCCKKCLGDFNKNPGKFLSKLR